MTGHARSSCGPESASACWGQERLPLAGPHKYLGQHFPIPVGMKVEVKPEEGE
jgi:hypothetical protein